MPRASCITRALVAEVAVRRIMGEAWKRIGADLRARGLPGDRATWLRAGVPIVEPEHSCHPDVAQRRAAGISAAPAPPHEACIPT